MKRMILLGLVMMFLLVTTVDASYEWVDYYDYGTGEEDWQIAVSHSATMEKNNDHLYVQHPAGDNPRPGGLWSYTEELDFSEIKEIEYYVNAQSDRPFRRVNVIIGKTANSDYDVADSYYERYLENIGSDGSYRINIDVSDIDVDGYLHIGPSSPYTDFGTFTYRFYEVKLYEFTDHEITAIDSYTNESIDTFNATITNSTDTTTFTTTNGSIPWEYGDEDLLNITFESGDYFSKNYTDVNITESFEGDFEGELHSTELSLEVFNIDGSVAFDGWDYCINNTDNDISGCGNSGSSEVLDFNLTYGNYSISVGGSSYPVQTRDITLSPLEQSTESFNMSFNSNINLIDEATLDSFNVSETNETRVSIICDDVGQYSHTFTSSNDSVEIPCVYNKLRFVVSYDDTAYTRTLLQDDLEPFTQDVYLLDLTTTQTIRNSFVVNDYVSIYEDPEIFFSKDIEGGRVTIHSDQLDTENKVTAYFIENSQYIMTLKSSNREDLNLGFYGADVPGDKEITVTSSDINLNRGEDLQDQVSVYAYTTSDDNYNTSMNLKVGYYDGQVKTESLDWRIEYINGSDESSGRQLWDSGNLTGLDTEFVSFEQDISDLINDTVYLELIYDREDEDSETYEVIIHEPSDDLIPGTMFEFYDSTEIQWAMIMFLSVVALSGTMVTQVYVNYFLIGFAAIMSTATFGLMNLSSLIVALSILLNIIYHLSTAEKSHDTIIRRMR